jgi:hypothetical protein
MKRHFLLTLIIILISFSNSLLSQTFLWEKYFVIDTNQQSRIYGEQIFLQPNGEMLIGFENDYGSTGYTGMIKFDQAANKLWDYTFVSHGDYDVGLYDQAFFQNKSGQYSFLQNQLNWLLNVPDKMAIQISIANYDSTGTLKENYLTNDTLSMESSVFLANEDKLILSNNHIWSIYDDSMKFLEKKYLNITGDGISAYQRIPGGGIAVVYRSSDTSISILRTDDNFNKIFQTGFYSNDICLPAIYKIIPTFDGNFCLFGYYLPQITTEMFLWKFDSTGKEMWKKIIPIAEQSAEFPPNDLSLFGGCIENYYHDIVAVGSMPAMGKEFNEYSMFYIVQLDESGKLKRTFTWGDTTKNNQLYDIVETPERDLIVVGNSIYTGELYLAKIHDLSSDVGDPEIKDESSFEVYPNPTTGKINLKLDNLNPSFIEVEIIDNLGNNVS